MQTVRKIIAVMSAAFLLAVIVPVSALADDSGTVIYKNDFSGESLDETMTYLNSGTVEFIKDGANPVMRCKARTDGNRAFKMNFGPEEVKNVDLSFRMRLLTTPSGTSLRAGVFFRSTTIPAYDMLAYQMRFLAGKASLVLADSFGDTSTVTLAENPEISIDAGHWNNIKVCLRETRIIVYFNGTLVVDYIDETYPASGGFGFTTYGMDFDVDDIIINGYTGKTLPDPTPNEVPIWVGDPLDAEEADIADSGTERLNLFGFGGGEDDSTVHSVVDPDELTVNSYIAIGLIAALLIMAASTLFVSLKLIKALKNEKMSPKQPDNSVQEIAANEESDD